MKNKLFQNHLIVKKSLTHGYGVFAKKAFRKGELIEECYILLSKRSNGAFEDFYFDARGKYALLLGFGSIYNHADNPNADYTISVRNRVAIIKAERAIKKGEEIFVSYGEEWFKSRGIHPKNMLKKSRKK